MSVYNVVHRGSTYRCGLVAAMMLFIAASVLSATVRVSFDDGRWEDIYWLPGGVPQPGDTIIIASAVTGMPALEFGKLTVRPSGSVSLASGTAVVHGLEVQGMLRIDRTASIAVLGTLVNNGIITGDGVTEMSLNGSIISGAGRFGHLLIGSAPGTATYLSSSIAVPSLTLASGTRLIIGANDLTVDGPYTSLSAYGEPGIVATSGVIHLNGSVYGTASGSIEVGTVPGARRGQVPEMHGLLGAAAKPIVLHASRVLLFSELVGNLTVDSGVVVRIGGLGTAGRCTITGSATIRGTLRADDPGYRLIVDGDLFNEGSIEECTIVLSGFRATLASDHGVWDPSINLTYIGTSGSRLQLQGPLVVARLLILPQSAGDSDVVLAAGSYPLRVRHSFESDTAHGCRITTDTIVRLWGEAHGDVEGAVQFEGFWGSDLSGRFGRADRAVAVAVPKRIAAATAIRGVLTVASQARLEIAGPINIAGNLVADGVMTFTGGSVLTLAAGASIRRDVAGSGTIGMTSTSALLDARGRLERGVALVVGSGATPSHILLARTLHAADVTVYPGSTITQPAGDTLDVGDTMRVIVRYEAGYNTAAAACSPFDPRAAMVFPGSTSVLRYETDYVAADSITVGTGYYVRFPGAATVVHRGHAINLPLDIPIHAGWNLVGAASVPAAAAAVTVQGTTLLSGFVNSIGGDTAVTTLEPGHAYWVHAAGAGTLRLQP